jgi:hypothetical protein
MTEFITAAIATILKYVEAHPDHANEASQIFRLVTHKTLTPDMLCVPDQPILERITRLHSSSVAI